MVVQSRQPTGSESEGKTAFHLAVENNQQKVIQMLMRLVPDLDCRDAKGRTAMHLAVQSDHVSVVEILAGSNNAEWMNSGTRHFANVNVQDVDGLTPLHYAVTRGKLDMVEKLLTIPELDMEIKDFQGHTPLHRALLSGFDGVAEALIAKGADFNARVG